MVRRCLFMENKEKFEELMKNEDFVMKILELQTPAEIEAEFETNGVKLSKEEVNRLRNEFDAISEVLNEEYLSYISGGDDTVPSEESWSEYLKKCGKQVINKALDKIGEGLGIAMWAIPTAILLELGKDIYHNKIHF